jgi:hypothetical protein
MRLYFGSCAAFLGLNRRPLVVPGGSGGAAGGVVAGAAGAPQQSVVGADPRRLGDRLRDGRPDRRQPDGHRAHLPRPGRGAAAGRACARRVDARRTPGARAAGRARVRTGLGRPRCARRRRRGGGAVGAQLRRARRADRGGDAAALAGARDRRDGARRLGPGDLRPAAAAQQRPQRRSPGGGPAAPAVRGVRLGRDGLRRPVRRGAAGGAAGQDGRSRVSVQRGVVGGGARDRVRPAVLRRR